MYFASLFGDKDKLARAKKKQGTLQQQPNLRHQLADWLRAWEKRTLVNQRHTRGATGRSWRGCTWNVKGTRGCSRRSIQRHWSIGLRNAQHRHTETAKGANTTMPHGSLNTFTGLQTQIPVWLEAHRPVVMAAWSPRFLYRMIWVDYCKHLLCKRGVCVKKWFGAHVCSCSPHTRACPHTCKGICPHIIHQPPWGWASAVL